ncbi:uncharacterized protein CLUP02_08081 [Colletotrichum lupini]|uniref:Uncharacterized protein n=1 Tax=Colletotrichum lupini TaxID=145971 RepID=A0A9Q8SSA9_9PEZI|nr:uncharacterized protein CLUP02_08081 [Colletotrichum lupini]UQC82591.1 hypothetical protein CLUP02_08081 [Colletotrichum lupini]
MAHGRLGCCMMRHGSFQTTPRDWDACIWMKAARGMKKRGKQIWPSNRVTRLFRYPWDLHWDIMGQKAWQHDGVGNKRQTQPFCVLLFFSLFCLGVDIGTGPDRKDPEYHVPLACGGCLERTYEKLGLLIPIFIYQLPTMTAYFSLFHAR